MTVQLYPRIHTTRPLAERIERLQDLVMERYGVARSAIRVVRAPLRISPLGAHIDHQLGRVMGMAVDRAILLAFAPTSDGTVHVESCDFPTPTVFNIDQVPPRVPGDWGNYLRGAVLALQQEYSLRHGIVGVMDSDLPIGGLSSSAAVTIAYLLALESVNELAIEPRQNIRLVTRTEHDYIGLNNGILDQTSVLYSQRNQLTRIDCQSVEIERVPTSASSDQFAILAVYSGVAKALVGTSYNNRVAECLAAAQQLSEFAGTTHSEPPRLRMIDPEHFAAYAHRLDEPLRRRATHFFSEMARVDAGEAAWRAGQLDQFGALMTASGQSSVENYECGCPQLITLYNILRETPGVYGVRFSGAGFRGNCLAFIDPAYSESIAERVARDYPSTHPEIADQYSLHLCQSADAAQVLE
jgi:galactokinase